MGDYTRVGCSIWSWEPFLSLLEDDGITPDYRARNLWWALYTSAEARRTVPGLMHASISSIADAAHMPGDDVVHALDKLLEHDLVEFDREKRVVRLTKLPDALDGCDSGNVIRGWYGRFRSVPACAVRDAHIRLLRWIVDETNREPSKKKGIQNREEAWAETFATIPLPAVRRRGQRRLADHEGTGTVVQPSLFDALRTSASRSGSHDLVADAASRNASRTLPETTCSDDPDSDLSDQRSQSLTPGGGTLPEGFGKGLDRNRIRIGNSDQEERDTPDQERAAIENAHRRPALALVPACTPESLVDEISLGIWGTVGKGRSVVRETLRDALRVTIRVLDERGWGLAEALSAGRWLGTTDGQIALKRAGPSCPPNELVSVWASSPHDVVRAIETMQERERAGAERAELLRQLTGSGHAS